MTMNGTTPHKRVDVCARCHSPMIPTDPHKCALPEEIESMAERAEEIRNHQERFKAAIIATMDKHTGTLSLLEMADVLDGQTQRLRTEYERIKLSARKVRGRKK